MSSNQVLTTLGKLFFYPKINRVLQTDPDERYFRDCEDEYYELLESKEDEYYKLIESEEEDY